MVVESILFVWVDLGCTANWHKGVVVIAKIWSTHDSCTRHNLVFVLDVVRRTLSHGGLQVSSLVVLHLVSV